MFSLIINFLSSNSAITLFLLSCIDLNSYLNKSHYYLTFPLSDVVPFKDSTNFSVFFNFLINLSYLGFYSLSFLFSSSISFYKYFCKYFKCNLLSSNIIGFKISLISPIIYMYYFWFSKPGVRNVMNSYSVRTPSLLLSNIFMNSYISYSLIFKLHI